MVMAMHRDDHKALIWDSLPPDTEPDWAAGVVAAVLKVAAAAQVDDDALKWDGAGRPWTAHQVRGPIQVAGSNDCLFHAVRTAHCLLHNLPIAVERPEMGDTRHHMALLLATKEVDDTADLLEQC